MSKIVLKYQVSRIKEKKNLIKTFKNQGIFNLIFFTKNGQNFSNVL